MGLLSKNFNYKGCQCIWITVENQYHIFDRYNRHMGIASDKYGAKALIEANQK